MASPFAWSVFVRACLLPFHGDFPPIFDFSPFSVLVIPMRGYAKTFVQVFQTVCPSSLSSVVDFSQKFDSSKPWTWQTSQDIANTWQSFVENINCGWLHCSWKLLLQKASRLWPPILYSWGSFCVWWGYVKPSKLKHLLKSDAGKIIWSAAQGLATTIRKWYLGLHGVMATIDIPFTQASPRNVWVHQDSCVQLSKNINSVTLLKTQVAKWEPIN